MDCSSSSEVPPARAVRQSSPNSTADSRTARPRTGRTREARRHRAPMPSKGRQQPKRSNTPPRLAVRQPKPPRLRPYRRTGAPAHATLRPPMTVPTTEAARLIASAAADDPGPLTLIRAGLAELFGRRRLTRYLVGADIKRTHSRHASSASSGGSSTRSSRWPSTSSSSRSSSSARTPDYPLFIFAAILPWKWFIDDAQRRDPVGHRPAEPHPPDPVPQDRPADRSAVIAGTVSFALRPDRARASSTCSTSTGSALWVLLTPDHRGRPVPVHHGRSASCCPSLNAFFRDIQNVMRHALRLWFYLSPAPSYSLDASIAAEPPDRCTRSCQLNPFAVLFDVLPRR